MRAHSAKIHQCNKAHNRALARSRVGRFTPDNEKEEAVQYLAAVSLMNGSASAAAWGAALTAAQRAGVTTSEYLHERLLLGAGIPTQ